jgi:hypothetical protein
VALARPLHGAFVAFIYFREDFQNVQCYYIVYEDDARCAREGSGAVGQKRPVWCSRPRNMRKHGGGGVMMVTSVIILFIIF